MKRSLTLGLVLQVIVVMSGATMRATSPPEAATLTPGGSPAPPAAVVLDPTMYSAVVDNPWFPLRRGQRLIYRGHDARGAMLVTMDVRRSRAIVAGLPCTVVKLTLSRDGIVTQRSTQWYTEDAKGTVWSMGAGGASGWQAGVDGARQQPVLPVDPRRGDVLFRAGDVGIPASSGSDGLRFVMIQADVDVSVPFGSFTGGVRTIAWLPLMAGPTLTVFVPLIGVVRVTTRSMDLRLVKIRTPRTRRGSEERPPARRAWRIHRDPSPRSQ